ncbi:MAG: hypothetical protein ABF274_00160 [Nonlabens sp.]|uniref:hypothetical protein n=1 Tax=Nonlabens sp. TaxID=1888209 RepID=UPI00321B075C
MNKHLACSSLQRFFYVSFIFFVLAFAKADAQQSSSVKNETQFLQSSFNVVDIDLNQYLELEIKTTDNNNVKITTDQSGEYKNAVILSSSIRNDSLLITDPISPSFSFPEDKLSAHKVIDGKATLFLPKNKSLIINTQSADISISGDFKKIYINQLSGSCKINKLKGDVTYVSAYADVFLELTDYSTTVFSRSGKVSTFKKPNLIKYFALIETVSGNISHLKKTKK